MNLIYLFFRKREAEPLQSIYTSRPCHLSLHLSLLLHSNVERNVLFDFCLQQPHCWEKKHKNNSMPSKLYYKPALIFKHLGIKMKRDNLKLMRQWELASSSGGDNPWVLLSHARWESCLKTACQTLWQLLTYKFPQDVWRASVPGGWLALAEADGVGKWFILKIILSYAMSLGVQVYHVVLIQIRKKKTMETTCRWK